MAEIDRTIPPKPAAAPPDSFEQLRQAQESRNEQVINLVQIACFGVVLVANLLR